MSLSMRLVTAFMVLVIVGAAIWAEGGVRAVLAEPPLVAFLAVSFALLAAANLTQGNLNPGVREARDNRWVIAAFAILGLAQIAISIGFDRPNILTLDGEAARWLGVTLYAAGGVLRLAPVFVLGRRFSGLVAIQPGHTLVTSGLYARIRNPSYLGLIVSSVGAGLTFRSGPGLILALALIWPLNARMEAEERLLEETFGDEYRAYRARTARLVPGLY